MSLYMQSLYIEVTPAAIPEGIFLSKHKKYQHLKQHLISSHCSCSPSSVLPGLISLLLLLYKVHRVQMGTFSAVVEWD